MALKYFQAGDRVLDTGTGNHGTVLDSDFNAIVPGLERSRVELEGGRIERFYWTRLQLIEPEPPSDEPPRAFEPEPAEKAVEAPKKRTPRKTTPKAAEAA